MITFIRLLGALQLIGGVLAYLAAASAIHEILGAILFGMGTIALALGVLIERADKQIAAFDRFERAKA